ncbi:MAG: ribbon-helix-helix domain-containing protein [Actinobacteria bacterium]|nr:ribbon-helix-helix domain-containing protein [Actinomycetota bacterium]
MRRTTIYLDAELDMQLRAESRRRNRPVAEIIREILRERFNAERNSHSRSPHAGSFSSGTSDTASRVDDVLAETGFGTSS